MSPIKLETVLNNLVNRILIKDNRVPDLYLKDDDKEYHLIYEVNLFTDRFKCEGGYWYCYDWILEAEKNNENVLFIDGEIE